jgi:hypothetical protein
LPLNVKLARGLDPNSSDSDGDGRSDADELADQTDPGLPDSPQPPNALLASPTALTLTANIGQGQVQPQAVINLTARQQVDWTASVDAPWLVLSKGSGKTSGSLSVVALAGNLGPGTYNANITIASSAGNAVIPVILTVQNDPAPWSPNANKTIYIPATMVNAEPAG